MRAVNLTPPDKRRTKKGAEPGAPKEKTKLGPMHMAGAAILIGALALAYMGHSARGQANEKAAQADELEGQVATLNAQIAAEKAKQSGGAKGAQPNTYETDRQLVTGLSAARVNWSTVMVNLSRVAPRGVWLNTMKIATPAADGASGGRGATVERPAAITLDAMSDSRTDAALFLSRLDAIPGFDKPRLNGGINVDDSATDAAGRTVYKFTVEVPVDDAIFGPVRGIATPSPTAPASTSSSTSSTTTTTNTGGASSSTTTTTTP